MVRFSAEGRAAWFLVIAFLLCAALFFAAFGLLGVGRGGGSFAFDMPYLFAAGELWEKGASPYDAALFKQTMKAFLGADSGNYAYPPNASYLSMSLSLGELGQARTMMGIFNMLALAATITFVWAGAAQSDEDEDAVRLRTLLLASAVVLGNPFSAHVSWMGQTTLISGAFLLWAWYMADQRRDVAAGLLLALGAFKPQLAILIAFWFLLDRRWMLLLAAAAGTLAISAWPMMTTGIAGSWISWLTGLREYQDTVFNTAGFKHLFGIRSALANFGVEVPSLAAVGVLGVVALYLQRRAYENIWLVGAVLSLTFLFVYAHDYDIAPATILAYPLLRACRGNIGLTALVALLACVLFFPQRIWEAFGMDELARSREVALLAILGLYLTVCRAPEWRRVSSSA